MAADSVAQTDLDPSSTPVDTSARGRRRRAAPLPEPVHDAEAAVVPQESDARPRRGRQRAAAAPASDGAAAEEPAQQVNGTGSASGKRRGRKKAQPVEVAPESVVDTPAAAVLEAAVEHPAEVAPEVAVEPLTEAVSEQPKRRRGRPPRAATVNGAIAPDAVVQPATRGNGSDPVDEPVSGTPRRARRPRSERETTAAAAVAVPLTAPSAPPPAPAPTSAVFERDYDPEMVRLQHIWPQLVGQARRAVVLYAANLAIESD